MKIIVTLFLFLVFSSAFAQTSYNCEEARSGSSARVEASSTGTKAALTVFKGNRMESAVLIWVVTTQKELAPLLQNKLRAMDKKVISSGDTSASFKIDGYDFAGNPRLGIRISSPKGEFSFSSCTYLPGASY